MPHWGISVGGGTMKNNSFDAKSYIANYANNRCNKQSCWYCAEADKYKNLEDCPFFKLKQIARERTVTSEDITDDVIKASGFKD